MAANRLSAAGFHLSLAQAEPGEALEVVAILFGSLRERCEGMGIRIGTRMRLLERTPDAIRLEMEGGRPVELGVLYAPFVEVLLLPQAGADRIAPAPESAPPIPPPLYDRTQTLP